MDGTASPKATFRDVFAVGEFRALWLAQILSVLGDQLARVALSVLVFNRTGSALLTAATYAVTYLPWVFGALFLSGLGDRFPRRSVLVVCDVGRAGLVALMALPGLPLWVLVALLFLITLIETPFDAARAAITPDILPGERYVLGMAVARTTNQMGFVAGFAVGGMVVQFVGVRPALLLDAGTFALSALLIALWVRARPAVREKGSEHEEATSSWRDGMAGVRLVFGDPTLRRLTLFAWLAMFYVVPEGLAVPYAHTLGGSPITAGLLLAAMPLGAATGAIVYSRALPQNRRLRAMAPLAIGTCLALAPIAIGIGLAASLLVLITAGALSSYQLAANTAFVQTVSPQWRSQAFGVVQAGFSIAQSTAIVLAGWIAEATAPGKVIGVTGAIGAGVATVLAVSTRRIPEEATSSHG